MIRSIATSPAGIVMVDEAGLERHFASYPEFRDWWFSEENKAGHVYSLKGLKRERLLKTAQIAFPFSRQRRKRKAHK